MIDRFMILWRRLISPVVEIGDPDSHQQARLLAGLSLSILLIAITAITLTAASYTGEQLQRLAPLFGGVILFTVPYYQSRRGAIRYAVISLGAIASLLICAAAFSLEGESGREVLHYLILVIAFIAVFVNIRTSIAYVLVLTMVIFLYQAANPSLEMEETFRDVVVQFVLNSAFLTLFISFGRRNEQQKRELLAASERQRAELVIRQQINAQLHAFISATTHDFGTRMSLVETNRYMIQRILEKSGSADAVRPNLEKISMAVGQIKTQLENMNMIMGLENAERVQVDLDVIAAQVAAEMQEKASRQNVRLVYHPSLIPVCTEASPTHVAIAVSHLVDNAINYTSEGGEVLIVSRYEAGQANIVVRDTGIGVLPEDRIRIFEPFYKADPARTTTRSGLGLGLTIVRLIAEAYSGVVDVTSGPQQGSIFTLRFPSREKPITETTPLPGRSPRPLAG